MGMNRAGGDVQSDPSSSSGIAPETTATTPPSFAHLLPPSWKATITEWLAEDIPSFDYGGFVVGEAQRSAHLLGKGKSEAVLAGAPFFEEVFKQLGCESV